MRGHVGKREGKRRVSWYYSVDLGRDEATGERKQVMRRGFRTQKEAESEMRKVIRSLEDGTYVSPSKKTLAEYLNEWKEDYVAHNVRPSTAREYIRIIDRNIIPNLGYHRMQELHPQHIQKYVSKMLKSGRVRGEGGLSPSTVRGHIRVLSEALKHAVDMQEVITSNPADKVKKPRVPRFRPQIVTAEIANLIMAEGTPWLAAICLTFYSGIRRSELCGLRWRDIDFEKSCLTVDRARVAVKGGSVEGEPKSESSRRLISMSTNIDYILYYHMREQQRMFEALDIPWTEDCHVFCNDWGKPCNPTSVTHAFKRFATRAGFPNVRLHDSRHGHATIMLKAEVHPKVVQARLGHSTIATTMGIYSHVLREMDVAAAEAFEDQLEDQFEDFG